MSKPLVISIPHELGKQEVKNRLQNGMGQIRSQLSAFATSIEDQWTEDRLEFRLSTLGQTVTGQIEVFEKLVRVEVHLPSIFALIGEKLGGHIQAYGTRMLEKR